MANARSPQQKQAKADAIAAAAHALNREVRFEDWTVAQVARRAGVAKGTVFLYYESKEALGLAIAKRLLGDWLDDLDRRLAEAAPLTPAAAAQAVARSLESRGALRRTLALVGQMEHAAGRAAVERYRAWLLERTQRSGERLEASLPFLRPGEGLRLMVLIQALVIGYHALTEPSPVVETVLAAEKFSAMRVDFRRAVAESVWMQLEGLRGERATRAESGSRRGERAARAESG